MKVGLVYDLRNPRAWFRPFPELYSETLDHIQAMDELGFDSINMTEHHFSEDGYCSSAIAWNAAAAVRTKRAMIGQYVVLMPFSHPVRLAEDIATLDILSNGRAWLQVGQGFRPTEFDGFGVDIRHRASLTAEGMEIVRKCFTEEEFSHTGRHYNLKNVRISPKPIQRPHPPMFLSAMLPNTKPMERTVEMGFHAATTLGAISPHSAESWQNWHAGWTETLRRHGRDPAQFQTATFTTVMVTEDPERAWHRHKEGILYQHNDYGSEGSPFPGNLDTPEEIPNWQQIFQTPDDAVRYFREVYGKVPPTHLIMWAARVGMTYQESYDCHQLFMERVLPRLGDLA